MLFFISVLFLFFHISVFSQDAVEKSIKQVILIETNEVEGSSVEKSLMKNYDSSVSSKLNFMFWFMGSKNASDEFVLPVGSSVKKQILRSGMQSNRLLIKAFMKKVVNYDSSVV